MIPAASGKTQDLSLLLHVNLTTGDVQRKPADKPTSIKCCCQSYFFLKVAFLYFHSKDNPCWPLKYVYEELPLLHYRWCTTNWRAGLHCDSHIITTHVGLEELTPTDSLSSNTSPHEIAENTSTVRTSTAHPAAESQRGCMDKGDDLQLRYRVLKPLCVHHKKKIYTPRLFCAKFVFVQSIVKALKSESWYIKQS